MLGKKDLSGVVYSCFSNVNTVGEPFFTDHILCYVISGTINAFDGDRRHTFGSGDLFLNKRNTLGRFQKYPSEEMPYQSISFVLDKESLMDFNKANNNQYQQEQVVSENVISLPTDTLLNNFFNSLPAWLGENMPPALVNLKKQEAVLLILKNCPPIKNVLFDYNDPYKSDLQSFMNRNFKFNADLPKLAYLTGRSLATFKRDFEKIFKMPPHRWIHIKRLEEAYYLIAEKNIRPTDVYLEVGFETLAHFSYAFKKHFGLNPSTIVP